MIPEMKFQTCPACKQRTLPLPAERASARCCQNPQCMTIVRRDGTIEGLHPWYEHLPGSGIKLRNKST